MDTLDEQIDKARVVLEKARDVRNAEYWAFTRQARGQPVRRETAMAVAAAEIDLAALLKWQHMRRNSMTQTYEVYVGGVRDPEGPFHAPKPSRHRIKVALKARYAAGQQNVTAEVWPKWWNERPDGPAPVRAVVGPLGGIRWQRLV